MITGTFVNEGLFACHAASFILLISYFLSCDSSEPESLKDIHTCKWLREKKWLRQHGNLLNFRFITSLSFYHFMNIKIKASVNCVSSAPVILDPNTANQSLALSDDLTSVRFNENKQPLPDNPERFDESPCVLGSEGFNSGTHCWDVEVKGSSLAWILGVTTASNQRKGSVFLNTDVWCVHYDQYRQFLSSGFRVKQKLECVRVDLDYDKGKVSFSDPVTNKHLHTFTTTFTDTVFPFFWCYDSSTLRILPSNS